MQLLRLATGTFTLRSAFGKQQLEFDIVVSPHPVTVNLVPTAGSLVPTSSGLATPVIFEASVQIATSLSKVAGTQPGWIWMFVTLMRCPEPSSLRVFTST